MKVDLWFAQHEGNLYFAVAQPGQEPPQARRCRGVKNVYQALRNKEHEVASVGIVSPEALGLE